MTYQDQTKREVEAALALSRLGGTSEANSAAAARLVVEIVDHGLATVLARLGIQLKVQT